MAAGRHGAGEVTESYILTGKQREREREGLEKRKDYRGRTWYFIL